MSLLCRLLGHRLIYPAYCTPFTPIVCARCHRRYT